jgi:hypothetical protein
MQLRQLRQCNKQLGIRYPSQPDDPSAKEVRKAEDCFAKLGPYQFLPESEYPTSHVEGALGIASCSSLLNQPSSFFRNEMGKLADLVTL